MSNPHKRKKLARLKALMESKVVKEDVVFVEQVPVVVDLVIEELEVINRNLQHGAIVIIDDLRLFGTKMNEDWTYITKESLLEKIEKRVEKSFDINDRFIILLSKKK